MSLLTQGFQGPSGYTGVTGHVISFLWWKDKWVESQKRSFHMNPPGSGEAGELGLALRSPCTPR